MNIKNKKTLDFFFLIFFILFSDFANKSYLSWDRNDLSYGEFIACLNFEETYFIFKILFDLEKKANNMYLIFFYI